MAPRRPRPPLREYPRETWAYLSLGAIDTETTLRRILDVWPSRWDLLAPGFDVRGERLDGKPATDRMGVLPCVYAPRWFGELVVWARETESVRHPPFVSVLQDAEREQRRWQAALALRVIARVRRVLDALQVNPSLFLGLDDVFAVGGYVAVHRTYEALA